MDWDKLSYEVIPTDYMYIMKSNKDGTFSNGGLVPFGTVQIEPHSSVLNYGQGLFEGMKAYRREDGEVQIFRPEQNAMRMKMGADRLLMVAPSVEQYIDAVKQVVRSNKRWVPPFGKGALYIRPLLFGSGSVMGIAPAPECTFLIYTNPICNVYKGRTALLNLLIEEKLPRAYPGGTGGVKNIGNYAPRGTVGQRTNLRNVDEDEEVFRLDPGALTKEANGVSNEGKGAGVVCFLLFFFDFGVGAGTLALVATPDEGVGRELVGGELTRRVVGNKLIGTDAGVSLQGLPQEERLPEASWLEPERQLWMKVSSPKRL
ncbi:hypothetical protein Fmac_005184 [Flemingia macrophylla]|uniref:Branched-chain-amino-acid aminotransferase n=1 Tax=Flemingia macrophylla TaxID=520843 RepID=A0ABD1N707_9FABA